ncbi:MAG TPA: IclR family transcriptional regulator [Rhizomicrobium sp.]|jgi:IclR family pca regulon transcriptional regulator|nr:IclR family transcriptional regulator [Rhizomicrobium sp.]
MPTKAKEKKIRSPARPASARRRRAADEDIIDPRYIVPGLSRGLALLQLFTRKYPMRTLADLASGLGLSRSAAYRLVYTLEKSGFIERDSATRRYRVTSKVLMLGFEYLSSQTLIELAQPALVKLGASIPASAYLVILDGWQSVYIARVAPSVGLVSNLQVGSRQPAHLTASGRVLLADLAEERLSSFYARLKRDGDSVARRMPLYQLKRQAAEDRSTGHVYHKSVLDPGLSSCAMPIRDSSGHAVAAITVVGMDNAVKAFGGEKSLARALHDVTEDLSMRLGFRH